MIKVTSALDPQTVNEVTDYMTRLRHLGRKSNDIRYVEFLEILKRISHGTKKGRSAINMARSEAPETKEDIISSPVFLISKKDGQKKTGMLELLERPRCCNCG